MILKTKNINYKPWFDSKIAKTIETPFGDFPRSFPKLKPIPKSLPAIDNTKSVTNDVY